MQSPVYDKLYQFSAMGGQMNLPAHQYLLATEPSIMFSTGSYSQAQWILPQIEEILQHRPLDYLFISHMESDECGGLNLFLKKYPKITILCSSFTAVELKGYGHKCKVIVCDEVKPFIHGDLNLKFFKYPAEVHLMDGLLVAEMNRGIFYSSDLMAHKIINPSKTIQSEWIVEVQGIDSSHLIDDGRREKLKEDLSILSPKFIAVGHGSKILI